MKFLVGKVLIGAAAVLTSGLAGAQELVARAEPVTMALPDAPGVSAGVSSSNGTELNLDQPAQAGKNGHYTQAAGKYDVVIEPGQQAARLSAHDKVLYGVKDSLSPISIIGWGLSAGYEQIVDGSPNYGTIGNTRTGKSFAQRLGAAAARDTSETVFSESILAPILREDPRYYKQGPGRNFFYRVAYAGTRPIFTRTDGGHTTLNLSYMGGNLAGSALTQAYYPPINRGVTQVMETFGGSIGGGALGDLASEFLPGILTTLHLKRRD